MPFAPAVVERTMKVQEVLMQAISGRLTWLEAEEILGWRPRTLRRWRMRYGADLSPQGRCGPGVFRPSERCRRMASEWALRVLVAALSGRACVRPHAA